VLLGKSSKKERLQDREEETLFPLSRGSQEEAQRGMGKVDPTKRGRRPVKFGSDLSSESESLDDDDETTKKGSKDNSASSTPVILH
jgi:hypothetical protein